MLAEPEAYQGRRSAPGSWKVAQVKRPRPELCHTEKRGGPRHEAIHHLNVVSGAPVRQLSTFLPRPLTTHRLRPPSPVKLILVAKWPASVLNLAFFPSSCCDTSCLVVAKAVWERISWYDHIIDIFPTVCFVTGMASEAGLITPSTLTQSPVSVLLMCQHSTTTTRKTPSLLRRRANGNCNTRL